MTTRNLIFFGCLFAVMGCKSGYKLEKTGEIPSGFAGTPMQAWDPYLFREGQVEHLFFGNLFCEDKKGRLSYTKDPKDKDFCAKVVFAIGYGVRDLRKGREFQFRTTPVFLPSTAGWDDNYVETPSVAKRGDTYYLAYSAWPKLPLGNKRYQLGVAGLKSKDLAADLMAGGMFRRIRKSPVVPRGSDTVTGFDRENAQEPSLVYNEPLDRFEIYYAGLRAPEELAPDQPLKKLAQLALGRACFDKDFYMIPCSGPKGEEPLLNANMPEVRLFKGRYLLVYSDLDELRKGRTGFPYGYGKIFLRTSPDGVNWSGPEVLLARPFADANERSGVHSASLSPEDSGGFTIAYQGWGLFPGENCLKNGERIMLDYSTGSCQQTSVVTAAGRLRLGL